MRTSVPFPIVISGPSGAGKTTLVARLIERDDLLCESVSATTRPARPGEVEGRDYFFVDRPAFDRMKKSDLVEWAEVHGELYGTPRSFVEEQMARGSDVVLNIDIQGGDSVKKLFPVAVAIFILPPSFEALEERIRSRGDVDEKGLETRLGNARREITRSVDYDYVVVNDDLDTAVAEVQAIVVAERARKERKSPDFVRRITGNQE